MVVPKTFPLGEVVDLETLDRLGEPFCLTDADLGVHVFIAGSTGSGKSRTATQIALDAFNQGVGIAVIDKHGETTQDLGAHLAKRVWTSDNPSLLKRVHYLQWSPFSCPRIDPFHLPVPTGTHPEFHTNVLLSMREARVDQVATHLNASTQGTESFEQTPRLLRNLKNALSGCTCPAPRRRLPLSLAHILLDVTHPRHLHVWRKLSPYLPPDCKADIAALQAMNNPMKARELTESVLNRLRTFFSSLLRESFGETSDTAAVLDLDAIIRKRHCLLVDLAESPYFSHLQGVTIGRMLASSIVETMIRMPREERPPGGFILLIEEAGELLSEPFLRYLGAVRKYGCRMIFCGQDLSTFRKKDVDLVPKIISQCGVAIVYNQRYPDDALAIARLLFQKSLNFEPLVQEVEREGPVDWIQVEDEGQSGQRSTTRTRGTGKSTGTSTGTQESDTVGSQEGWAETRSTQEARGEVLGTGKSTNARDQKTVTESEQASTSRTATTGLSSGDSGSRTESRQWGTSKTWSTEHSESQSTGQTDGHGWSRTKKWVHLARKIRELQATGQLQDGPTSEQMEYFRTLIMELPPRHAIVKRQAMEAVPIRSADVPDAFSSPEAMVRSVEWLKRQLLSLHPYLMVPTLGSHREDERVEAFLAQGGSEGRDARVKTSSKGTDGEDSPSSPLSI